MTDPEVNDVNPALLAAAHAIAAKRGERLEDVIERRLREYVAREDTRDEG